MEKETEPTTPFNLHKLYGAIEQTLNTIVLYRSTSLIDSMYRARTKVAGEKMDKTLIIINYFAKLVTLLHLNSKISNRVKFLLFTFTRAKWSLFKCTYLHVQTKNI